MGLKHQCPHPRLPSNAADGILAASGGMSCQLTTFQGTYRVEAMNIILALVSNIPRMISRNIDDQRPAQGHIHHLNAAADAQEGLAALRRQAGQVAHPGLI